MQFIAKYYWLLWKHRASLNTICLITAKKQFYEVIYFVFIEDLMHCVVVSKIPSHLYKFVQLPERLKEKKINLSWNSTEIRLPWLGRTCQQCLNSFIISKVTMFQSIRILAPVLICMPLVYLVSLVMWTFFFLFAFYFCFYGSYYIITWCTRNYFHLHVLISSFLDF